MFRLVAHLLIRLLIVTPLPAQYQALAALFPVSILWPLVAPTGAARPPTRGSGNELVEDAARKLSLEEWRGPDRGMLHGKVWVCGQVARGGVLSGVVASRREQCARVTGRLWLVACFPGHVHVHGGHGLLGRGVSPRPRRIWQQGAG